MKLPRSGCLTSSVFDRLGIGSVGLVVSDDVFGFDRFRLTRFVDTGGDVVITIISGSTFFSRFDVFFFE